MSLPEINDFATRRKLLADEIARQRVYLTQAYDNLEKPIRYAEYGMKGYSIFRNYQWVFMAVPPVISIFSALASNFFGRKKEKARKNAPPVPPAASPQTIPGPYLPGQQQAIRNQPEGVKKAALIWAGRAWELFQLYRRVKPYFL